MLRNKKHPRIFFSIFSTKILANKGDKGAPIGKPFTCLKNSPLN
jgi:hypothetical protein